MSISLENLKTVILDAQESPLQTGTPRRIKIQPVQNKATVFIGVRRSGKSTYAFQTIQDLLNSGVSRKNILYLNFFDDRLHALTGDTLGLVLDAYYGLYPENKGGGKVYCFFDEIQAIRGWEPFIDRLLRTENCEIFLTGSSARMLSKEIATQMRGRALSWEIFPFTFQEYLDVKGISSQAPFSTRSQLILRKAFDGYWQSGGFPEVIEMERSLRIKIHQEYLQAILFRDLIERHDASHPRAISDLAHWLLDNTASLCSVNKLTGYLQSLGHKVPKMLVADYLEWFEDAYFLFQVRLHDASLTRSQVNPKKIYCIDHALVVSTSSGILVNSGHLLENLVFVTLRRLYPNIYYYRSKTSKETDFVVPRRTQPILAIQVCESLLEPKTRKREVTALAEAMRELGISTGTIVTRDESEIIPLEQGEIQVVPVWRFLLEKLEE